MMLAMLPLFIKWQMILQKDSVAFNIIFPSHLQILLEPTQFHEKT